MPGRGRLVAQVVDSPALVGNPLGDPSARPLLVYLPPGYDDDTARRYPTIYMIQGFAGQVENWRNRRAFRPTIRSSVSRASGCSARR